MTVDNTVIINQPFLNVGYTTIYNVTKMTAISFQAVYAPISGGSGILRLQESNDGVNYVDIDGQAMLFSAPGSYIFEVDHPPYKWISLVYTPTSGAISLTVTVLARQDTIAET